jgi:fructose-1,6-bisphosphatase/inositol monophosphatase family enzyme
MTSSELLRAFAVTAAAVGDAVGALVGHERRARTDRPGQYALDVVADAAALAVLHTLPVAVLSEESGYTGRDSAPVTVVIDPVDGSTNAARGVPYWGTSLCAIDADGPLAAYVINHATGIAFTAARGGGARRAGEPIAPASVETLEESVIVLSGMPDRVLPWRQFRSLGSAALALCDVASGTVEGFVDGFAQHAPWDYLGGLLVCMEAGAVVVDVEDRPLVVTDATARRQLLAAATPALLAALRPAIDR